MADILSYAKAFSSPFGGDAVSAVRTIAAGRLNSARRRIAGALAERGHPVVTRSLDAFTAGKGSAWRPEVGLALAAHRRGSGGLAALQLGAAYASTGGAGHVEMPVGEAQWLYLDGWLQPVQGHCRLTAEAGVISIRSEQGSARYSLSAEGTWVPVEGPVGPWLVSPTGGLAPRYVTASGLQNSVEGFPWITTPPPVEPARVATAEARTKALHEGWKIILERAPVYATWVASTAAGCMLIEPSGSYAAQSGSSCDHPGLIAVDPPPSPLFCGELLVHECSHQHEHVYTMATPLVLPESQETSYSPIKRAHRTMDKVLTAAHAVGNMILYNEEIRRIAPLDADAQRRLAMYRTWFNDDYRSPLDQCEGLTEAGRSFWRSLRDAVDASSQR